VLAVDTDPQGYLSRTLGFEEEYNQREPNLSHGFKEPTEYDLSEFIVSHDEFDVVPSSVEMFTVQQDLIAAGWKPRERLSMLFGDLDDLDYEYVIVDAPPSLGVINDNVLLACDSMVIPVEAMDSSIHALDILLNQIETLEDRYEVRIEITAIVISNVHYPLDNEQQNKIEYFEDTFDKWCPVYEIRHRAAIKRSLSEEGTVFGADAEESDMNERYQNLAATLENGSEVLEEA
jgi:chromosome partitioning protein